MIDLSPDDTTLANGDANGTIILWDIANGGEPRTLTGHTNAVKTLAFSPKGEILASGSRDGTIRLWSLAEGKELATLLSLDEKDWLVVTPDGFFDGSPAAWRQVLWRFNKRTFDYTPVEAFFNEFYYMGLLADVLTGKAPKASQDIAKKDRRQPEIRLRLADSRLPSRTQPSTLRAT